MTTINNYSVSLSLDASDYIRDSSLSRKETSSLAREINQARSPADKYERSMNLLSKALEQGAIDQGTYNRLVEAAGHRMEMASRKSSNLATSIKQTAAAYISLRAIVGVGGDGLRLAADAEQAEIAFKVLLKSGRDAQVLMSDIQAFASRTPFQFPELREAGRMLLAFKFSQQEVIKELGVLGNIAAATNQPIGELAELVGKARVQTTIYSEDLNQFTGRGINVLDGLAAKFGVATSEVKQLASESKITFNDLNEVLIDLSENDFAGMMTEQSKTLNGELSTLKDNLNEIKQELGVGLLPLFKDLAEAGTGWARNFRVGMDAIRESSGFMDPASGGGLSGQAHANINQRMQSIEADKAFMAEQIRRRRAGLPTIRTSPIPAAGGSVNFTGDQLGGMIDNAWSNAADTITGPGGLAALGSAVMSSANMIAMSGMANTQELIKATKDDPAIKSLEVGTQEAYAFLTQATREQDQRMHQDEERRKQLEANADAQRKKMNEWLSRINDSLEKNGFKRFK